jgi:hypothetical protein
MRPNAFTEFSSRGFEASGAVSISWILKLDMALSVFGEGEMGIVY